MIGQYIEGKGWEVLCDNYGFLVGYVDKPKEEKPSDEEYSVLCSEPEIVENNS